MARMAERVKAMYCSQRKKKVDAGTFLAREGRGRKGAAQNQSGLVPCISPVNSDPLSLCPEKGPGAPVLGQRTFFLVSYGTFLLYFSPRCVWCEPHESRGKISHAAVETKSFSTIYSTRYIFWAPVSGPD